MVQYIIVSILVLLIAAQRHAAMMTAAEGSARQGLVPRVRFVRQALAFAVLPALERHAGLIMAVEALVRQAHVPLVRTVRQAHA